MNIAAWRLFQHNVRSDARRNLSRRPSVASVEGTLDRLHSEPLSLSRFGDGELLLMGGRSIHFQSADPLLAQRLREVAVSQLPGHWVGMPDIFGSLAYLTSSDRAYWAKWRRRYWRDAYEAFDRPGDYANAFVSRFYMQWSDKTGSAERFRRLRALWSGRPVLIIEGAWTGFGRGNDLLKNAESVVRVVCPAQNAFTRYDEILNTAIEHGKGRLALLALGPTATVLAHDLHAAGVRSLDLGHLDVEYEWMRSGATEKIAVDGKAAAEARDQSYRPDQDNVRLVVE